MCNFKYYRTEKNINQLEQKIKIDRFTGLLNKTAIEYYGEKELQRLKNTELLAMMILDMYDFKNINDRFEHTAGDHVLKEVAGIKRKSMADRLR